MANVEKTGTYGDFLSIGWFSTNYTSAMARKLTISFYFPNYVANTVFGFEVKKVENNYIKEYDIREFFKFAGYMNIEAQFMSEDLMNKNYSD